MFTASSTPYSPTSPSQVIIRSSWPDSLTAWIPDWGTRENFCLLPVHGSQIRTWIWYMVLIRWWNGWGNLDTRHIIFNFCTSLGSMGELNRPTVSLKVLRHFTLRFTYFTDLTKPLFYFVASFWLHPAAGPEAVCILCPAWVVSSAAYFHAQLRIAHLHLLLTCHYKTGNGFEFFAKLLDTSACHLGK